MSTARPEKIAYTVEEAAELLSISRAHVYRLLDRRELDSIQVGRSRRITHRQILDFVSKLETSTSSDLPYRSSL